MKKGNTVVFGLFKDRASVETAIERLKDSGFRTSDISVLMPEHSLTDDIGHVKSSKVPEGATAGAGTGLVLGGALGWLVGAGALAITGLAPLVAAGPIIAALAGAGVGGTVGGLAGGLIGLGVPEYEAKKYEGRVKEGGILLSVHADDGAWSRKAKDLLEELGAEDIASTSEESSDVDADDIRRRDGVNDRPIIL